MEEHDTQYNSVPHLILYFSEVFIAAVEPFMRSVNKKKMIPVTLFKLLFRKMITINIHWISIE